MSAAKRRKVFVDVHHDDGFHVQSYINDCEHYQMKECYMYGCAVYTETGHSPNPVMARNWHALCSSLEATANMCTVPDCWCRWCCPILGHVRTVFMSVAFAVFPSRPVPERKQRDSPVWYQRHNKLMPYIEQRSGRPLEITEVHANVPALIMQYVMPMTPLPGPLSQLETTIASTLPILVHYGSCGGSGKKRCFLTQCDVNSRNEDGQSNVIVSAGDTLEDARVAMNEC